MAGKVYTIVTNVNGRRILVVNQLLEVDEEESLKREDFDAIFINIVHHAYEENRLIARWTSPIRSAKCYMKPRFATSPLREFMRFANKLIDGYSSTPLDDNFTNYIEEVYTNIARYHVNMQMIEEVNTTAKRFFDMVKYGITRGEFYYTNVTIRGMTEGYTKYLLAWYNNQETLFYDDRVKFNQKMEELGYAERRKFIERIHTCPKCGHSHLLFMECCPDCSSSDIREEPIIHHFRCANVSPETTYEYDGQLRCPKCKKILRHIGVDYDRPARVYTCHSCKKMFLTSAMKVTCAACDAQTTPDKLTVTDVYEYELTNVGVAAFASGDALLQIEGHDIYSGYSTYAGFCSSISLFCDMPSYEGSSIVVLRYRYSYKGKDGAIRVLRILRNIATRVRTIKAAKNNNDIYFLLVAEEEVLKEDAEYVKGVIDQILEETKLVYNGFSAEMVKVYVFRRNERPEAFIKSLEENPEPIEINEGEII